MNLLWPANLKPSGRDYVVGWETERAIYVLALVADWVSVEVATGNLKGVIDGLANGREDTSRRGIAI
jgi:hypothetical protein